MDLSIRKHLNDIIHLVPTSGISVDVLEAVYPSDLSPKHAKAVNLVLGTVVNWYLTSVNLLTNMSAEKENMLTNMLAEKENMFAEKENMLTNMFAEKENMLTNMLAEKDKRIAEKDEMIATTQESSDRATALVRIKETYQVQKWGSVTRATAWKKLTEDGRVNTREFIPEQEHPRKDILTTRLAELESRNWKAEHDMYPDIIKAMKGLYEEEESLLVIDTHQNSDFHADIAVAEHKGSRLVYSLRYFLELKHLTVQPQTAENCGQVLDYFHEVRKKQPHRSLFVAILSNFSSAWVYIASYDEDGPRIYEYPCRTLADAVVFAEVTSKRQFSKSIPKLDSRFKPDYNVLAVGKHYFLLSVINPSGHISIRNQSGSPWQSPNRHGNPKGQFVMKKTHDGHSLENEIRILWRIRDAQCPHLPELVWAPEGDIELGIMPLGVPIQPPESPITSRKIVEGMIEGLRYLHGEDIIHRDIRLSNLILQHRRNGINVVIIDYETAYDSITDEEYFGGYICWPRRLLDTGTKSYTPTAADDLHASILVVLHMLFPRRFDDFDADKITSSLNRTSETLKILQVWKDIEASKIWGRFYVAARDENYDGLLEMADIFCHV